MSDQIKNINPWVEKLEQVSIPDVDGQWGAMKSLLDKEMPLNKKNRRILFFWLMISLMLAALFIWVTIKTSNPKLSGHRLNNTSKSQNSNSNAKNPDQENEPYGKATQTDIKDAGSKKINPNSVIEHRGLNLEVDKKNIANSSMNRLNGQTTKAENKTSSSFFVDALGNSSKKRPSYNKPVNNKKNKQTPRIADKSETNLGISSAAVAIKNSNSYEKKLEEKKYARVNRFHSLRKSTDHNKGLSYSNSKSTVASSSTNKQKSIENKVASNQLDNSSETHSDRKNIDISNNEISKSSPTDKVGKPPTNFQNDTASNAKALAKPPLDSTHMLSKKIDTSNHLIAKKVDSTKNRKNRGIALSAGIGLNEAFPVAGQYWSGLNANGNKNILTDYIPIPMLRVYIKKKIYFQMEAQFDAPQFTKNLVISSNPIIDTLGNSLVVTSQDSGTIKKLFYFNLPVSFHYSLNKNFTFGAGIQFSHLTNGASYYQTILDSSLNGYSTFKFISYKNGSLKNSPAFKSLQQNELRYMVDVNEHWKNIELGVYYNKAFSRFINLKITNSTITQGKNSSLQLYLRYILWKNKKAKELSPK